MSKLTYSELKSIYSEDNVFSSFNIDINITSTISNKNRIYYMTDILCQDLTENEQKIWERKGLAKCIDSVPEAITNLKVTEKYADSKVR